MITDAIAAVIVEDTGSKNCSARIRAVPAARGVTAEASVAAVHAVAAVPQPITTGAPVLSGSARAWRRTKVARGHPVLQALLRSA